MAKKQSSGGKSQGWTPDRRPARSRYWQRHSLRKNKIRNLMRQRVHAGYEKRRVRCTDEDGQPTDQFETRSMPIRDKDGNPTTKPRFSSKKEAQDWWLKKSGRKRWGKLTEWARRMGATNA